MATKEAVASQKVRLRAASWGARIFRNNSGVLFNQEGVPIRFGLGNESAKLNKKLKSSDFIGWQTVEITPDMVGKQVAVFVGIEAKSEGFKHREEYNQNSREYAQAKFIQLIQEAGGIAGFASNELDVDRILNDFYASIKK